jgi:hypothetical protein
VSQSDFDPMMMPTSGFMRRIVDESARESLAQQAKQRAAGA